MQQLICTTNPNVKQAEVLLRATKVAGYILVGAPDLTSSAFPMVGSPCKMTASLHGHFSVFVKSATSFGRQAKRLYSTDPFASANSFGSMAAMLLRGQRVCVRAISDALLIRLSPSRCPCRLR
jgi:hypothetical protein